MRAFSTTMLLLTTLTTRLCPCVPGFSCATVMTVTIHGNDHRAASSSIASVLHGQYWWLSVSSWRLGLWQPQVLDVHSAGRSFDELDEEAIRSDAVCVCVSVCV